MGLEQRLITTGTAPPRKKFYQKKHVVDRRLYEPHYKYRVEMPTYFRESLCELSGPVLESMPMFTMRGLQMAGLAKKVDWIRP